MKVLFNWRYYIIGYLCLQSFIFLFSEPSTDTENWYIALILSKALGLLILWLFAKLIKHWSRKGTIPELSDMLDEN